MGRIFIFLIAVLFFAGPVFAADLSVSNAGFAPSNIWYSKDPFYAGDKVRVYTIVFNGSAYDIAGTVEFLNNGAPVGKVNFSLAKGGGAQDLWVDWNAEEGKHTITARLVNVVADGPNGKQSVSLPNVETGTNERVVDIDPAVKEAQQKAQVQQIIDTQSQVVGKANDVAQAVGAAVPVPVKEGVSVGVSAVEQFRINEGKQLDLIKKQKIQEIEAIAVRTKAVVSNTQKKGVTAESTPNVAEKPFAYAMLAAVSVLGIIFEWKVLFYGVILYALYRFVKWAVYKIRNR